MFDDSRNDYVARRVAGYRRDYQRTHELDDTPINPDELRLGTLDTKHHAEDWWDLWHDSEGGS